MCTVRPGLITIKNPKNLTISINQAGAKIRKFVQSHPNHFVGMTQNQIQNNLAGLFGYATFDNIEFEEIALAVDFEIPNIKNT